jgi:hypothetical protein
MWARQMRAQRGHAVSRDLLNWQRLPIASVDDIHRLLTNQPAATPLNLIALREQERLELAVIPGKA